MRTLTIKNTPAKIGQSVAVKVNITSEGNELNTLFSLSFDPSLLAFQDVVPGDSPVPNSTFTANSKFAGGGHISVLVDTDNPFPVLKSKNIATVHFTALVAGKAAVAFSDVPAKSGTVSVDFAHVSSLYGDGIVNIKK